MQRRDIQLFINFFQNESNCSNSRKVLVAPHGVTVILCLHWPVVTILRAAFFFALHDRFRSPHQLFYADSSSISSVISY